MEVIHEAPLVTSFTPLSEHQSQTPESFFSGPPVLYYRSPSAQLVILESELTNSPALSRLADISSSNGVAVNGEGKEEHEEEKVIEGIEVWVTSENFLLYSPTKNVGLSIPYPSISLHAIQRLRHPSSGAGEEESQGLFMQITTSDGFDDHNPDDTISMTLIPSVTSPPAAMVPPSPSATYQREQQQQDTADPSEPPIQALFLAVSACANLHPDPESPSSDADVPSFDYESTNGITSLDGLPPPMPGSGGWITVENMREFFDEEGHWRGGGLGPGAGIVREREDDDGGENTADGGNRMEQEEEEGDGEETKWRRTE